MESEFAKLYDMLNKFDGTVMVGVDEDGILNSGRVFNNFSWMIQEDINKIKHMTLIDFSNEQYLSFPLDKITTYEGHFDEENNLILHLHNKMLVNIWIDQ